LIKILGDDKMMKGSKKKMCLAFGLILIISLFSLAPMASAEVPELNEGMVGCQSLDIDFTDIVDEKELNGMIDDLIKDYSLFFNGGSVDADVDFNGGGLGFYLMNEVVSAQANVNGADCYQTRWSAYFASGLDVGADASVDIPAGGAMASPTKVDADAKLDYYAEFDFTFDQWYTKDAMALAKMEMKFKPKFDGNVEANVNANVDNVKIDAKIKASAKTSGIVGTVTFDFDEPLDLLDLPVEENEEWEANISFTVTASIVGTIEANYDISGIPDLEDQKGTETIDLAVESGGEVSEQISGEVLRFRSGEGKQFEIADGTTTTVIPVYSVDLEEAMEELFEDDYYDDYYDYYDTRAESYEESSSSDNKDDYYEEEVEYGLLSGLGDPMDFLGDLDAEDFKMEFYFAPSEGMFVGSNVGMEETALKKFTQQAGMGDILNNVDMEMKPATKEEVNTFKTSRGADYYAISGTDDEGSEGVNWILVIAGIFLAIIVVVIILFILVRKRASSGEPEQDYQNMEDDPAGLSEDDGSGWDEDRDTFSDSPPEL